MTSVEKYKRNLERLIENYNPKSVLEIGVEKGISTKVFLDAGGSVTSLDINYCLHISNSPKWHFVQTDSSEYLKAFLEKGGHLFDLIFLDALYTKERLEHDVPICWKLLNEGGALVFNEYCDGANHRKGEVRDFVMKWCFENDLDYNVLTNRAGMAVVEK